MGHTREKVFTYWPQIYLFNYILLHRFFKIFSTDMRGFRMLKEMVSVLVIAPQCVRHRRKLLRSVSHNMENCSAVCPTMWKKGWCFNDKICSEVCPTTWKIALQCVGTTPWKLFCGVSHTGENCSAVGNNSLLNEYLPQEHNRKHNYPEVTQWVQRKDLMHKN